MVPLLGYTGIPDSKAPGHSHSSYRWCSQIMVCSRAVLSPTKFSKELVNTFLTRVLMNTYSVRCSVVADIQYMFFVYMYILCYYLLLLFTLLLQDAVLLSSKEQDISSRMATHQQLQARMKQAEEAVMSAQQNYQAVSAGLTSGADGQNETLAAQKIGQYYTAP